MLGEREVMIEVKTGESISLTQILRYLMSRPNSTVVIWRIANKQVLTFDIKDIVTLASFFERMVILRGERLLAYGDNVEDCGHACQSGYKPTSDAMMMAVNRLSSNIIETMPDVLEETMRILFDPYFRTSLGSEIPP